MTAFSCLCFFGQNREKNGIASFQSKTEREPEMAINFTTLLTLDEGFLSRCKDLQFAVGVSSPRPIQNIPGVQGSQALPFVW